MLMRFLTFLAAVFVLAFAAWPAVAAPPPSAGPFLYMTSQPTDYVGAGKEWSYTASSMIFGGSHSTVNGIEQVSLSQTDFPFGDWWYQRFAAPAGQPLVPGVYEEATRWPFQAVTEPGLDISGNGRGCNMLTGRFVVHDAIYGANQSIRFFDASFEQHCEGATPALYGEVRFGAPPNPLGYHSPGLVNCNTSAPTIVASTPTIYGKSATETQFVLWRVNLFYFNGFSWVHVVSSPLLLSYASTLLPAQYWWNAESGQSLGNSLQAVQSWDTSALPGSYVVATQEFYWVSQAGEVVGSDHVLSDRTFGNKKVSGHDYLCYWPAFLAARTALAEQVPQPRLDVRDVLNATEMATSPLRLARERSVLLPAHDLPEVADVFGKRCPRASCPRAPRDR